MEKSREILALSEDHWNSLSDEIKENIHLAVASISEDLESCKTSLKSLEKEKEAKVAEQQTEITNLTANYERQDALISELREADSGKSEQLKNKDVEINELNENISNLSTIQSELSAEVESITKERDDLREIIQKKDREMELIRDDRDRIRQDWEGYQRDKLSLRFKKEEMETKEFSFKQKLNRMEQDKKSMEEMTSWLEQQVKEKSEHVINIRKEMGDRLLQIEGDVEVKTIELTKFRDSVELQKKTIEELTKKNEEYIDQVKEASEERSQMENLYRSELEAQKKLTEIYKKTASELESRDGKYVEAIEELQKIVKQASDDYAALRESSIAEKTELQSQVEEMSQQMKSMREEVENANALLHEHQERGLTETELERMAPAAAAASRLLKRGKTLTQIYTEYVDLYNALEIKKEENKHLQDTLQEIMEEIEKKAPVLRRQREEYEQIQAINEDLQTRLDETDKHMNSIQHNYEEQTRRSRYLERAYKRSKLQINDLSIQIQGLLKELERARGGVVVDNDDEEMFCGDMNVSSTSGDGQNVLHSEVLISEGLVKVTGIRSMQEQNAKLREVVRDLTECCEEQEKALKEDKSTELANQLEDIRSQYENIQLLEKRHKSSLEIVTRQRDMYKMLLSHNGVDLSEKSFLTEQQNTTDSSDIPTENVHDASSEESEAADRSMTSPIRKNVIPPEQLEQLEENRATLLELQEDFRKYREDRLEHEKVQDTTIQKLRTENNDLRLTNARLSTKLEHSSEKFKTLDINVNNYKKEINILREMNVKYTASVAKFERDVEHLRTDLKTKVERASQLEVRCEHLRSENERLRNAELQTRGELDSYMRQKNTQEMLLSNLQSIENALERRDNESRVVLTNQIARLQRECEVLKNNLEKEKQSMAEHGKNWSAEMAESKKQLEEEKLKHDDIEKKLRDANELVKKLEEEKATLSAEAKKRSAGEAGGNVDADVAASEISHLKKQLKELERENSDLSAQVSRQIKQIDNYKAISEGTEEQLEEQAKLMKLLEEQMSENLQEEQSKTQSLQKEIEEHIAEKSKILHEKDEKEKENKVEIEKLRLEISEAKGIEERIREERKASELNTNEEITIKEELINSLRADNQTREIELREISDKYQSELKQHAEDVRLLSNARDEVEKLISEREEWKKEADVATNEASRREREYLKLEADLEKQKSDLNDRIYTIQHENKEYQEQIERFGSQIISLRKAIESASEKEDEKLVKSDELKTSEDLLQVVQYLRREKELAESESGRLQVENARITQRMVDFDRKVSALRDELNNEREKNKTELASAQHHAELMAKIEQLNLLTESNRLMRSERANLENELKETQDSIGALKLTIEPLREELDALREKNTTLEGSASSLEEEVERWKRRCTQLIERQEKLDPEVFKKACEDRDEFQQTLSVRTAELEKTQLEVNRLNESLADKDEATKELNEKVANLTTRNEELNADVKSVTLRLENQVNVVAKKETSITQLREIAKKYKSEAEALKKKDNEGRLQEELKTMKEANVNTRSQLTSLQNENKSIKLSLQEMSQKRSSQSELISKLSSLLHGIDASDESVVIAKAQETIEETRKSLERLTSANSELSTRLNTVTAELTSGAEERNELTLRSRLFEGQVQKFSKENIELKKIVKHLKQNLDRQTQQTAVSAPVQQNQNTVQPPIGQQTPLQQTQTSNQESVVTVAAAGSSVSGGNTGGTTSVEEKLPPSAASPPVSAAATVVRVQPTVSSSNGSGVGNTGGAAAVVPPQQSRQMAEIRPMPSVACVMPTPAPQEQQQQTQSGTGDNVQMALIPAAPLQITSVVSLTLPESQTSTVAEPMEHQSSAPQSHQQPQQAVTATAAVISTEPSTSSQDVGSDQPMTSTLIGSRGSKRRADEVASAQISFDFAATAKRLRSTPAPVGSSTNQASETPVSVIPPSEVSTNRSSPPVVQQQQVSPQPRSQEDQEPVAISTDDQVVSETPVSTEAEPTVESLVQVAEGETFEVNHVNTTVENEEGLDDHQIVERVMPVPMLSNEGVNNNEDTRPRSGQIEDEVMRTEEPGDQEEVIDSQPSDDVEEVVISVEGGDVNEEFEGEIGDEEYTEEEDDVGNQEDEEACDGDMEDEVEDDGELEEEGDLVEEDEEDEEEDDEDPESLDREEDLESGVDDFDEDVEEDLNEEDEEEEEDEGEEEEDEEDDEDESPPPTMPPRPKALDVIELSSDDSDGGDATTPSVAVKSQANIPSSVVVSKPLLHGTSDSVQLSNIPEISAAQAAVATGAGETVSSGISSTSRPAVPSRREKIEPIVWGDDRTPRPSAQHVRGTSSRTGFARRSPMGGHMYRGRYMSRGPSQGNFSSRRGNRPQ